MSTETKETIKKIGLFTLIAFCMGDTIGAGIFSTLPLMVGNAGSGIGWVWVGAVSLTIFVNIPSVLPSSSLPCPSASYTIPCRLLNPYIGFFELVNMMNYFLILGLICLFYASYVAILIPGINQTVVALAVLIVFWIINIIGVEMGTVVQNVLVALLAVALVMYIVIGVPHVSSENLTFGDVIAPEISFAGFCAALAMGYTCLGGSFTGCLVLGDRVRNPKKTLILGGCLTAIIVGVLYGGISIVTCGITDAGAGDLPVLGDIAKTFMPGPAWYYFMICGALFAMMSTINAVILSVGYRFDTMAADGIFPGFFDKKSRFGTKPICISIAPILAVFMILFNLPIDMLITACAVLAVLGGILRLLPVLILPKRYPHTYKRALISLPTGALWFWVITAIVILAVVSISTILSTNATIWISAFGTLAAMYIYFLIRIRYAKGKGIDVYANMSADYPEWDEREAEYAAEDEAAGK